MPGFGNNLGCNWNPSGFGSASASADGVGAGASDPTAVANYLHVSRIVPALSSNMYSYSPTISTDWDTRDANSIAQFSAGNTRLQMGSGLLVKSNEILVQTAGVYMITFTVEGTQTLQRGMLSAQILVNDSVVEVSHGTLTTADDKRTHNQVSAMLDLAINDVITFGHRIFGDTGGTNYYINGVHVVMEEYQ